MAEEFRLPDLGEGVREGQVLRLLVGEGERVDEDQPLMEVETDKSAVEIPSPHAGVIARWHVHEQQVVNVGDVMVTFGDGLAAGSSSPAVEAAVTPAVVATSSRPPSPPVRTARPATTRKPASPAVRKLARELGIDLETVRGSGPGGRIMRGDLDETAATAAPPSPSPAAPTIPIAPTTPIPIARVEPAGRDDNDAFGPVKRETISQTRRAIATTMHQATSTIPHVTDCNDADVTELDRLRRGYNAGVTEGERLSLLPFVIRAVVRGLVRHPVINACYDERAGEIIYKRYYNIAVGVQTERGLIAPVLHEVDRLSISEIGRELARLFEKARSGTFSLDDTRGATYTISNAGAMGPTRYATPIITAPQVAVLAVGRSRSMPWVVDGAIVPRLIMPLSHSMDHRVIDGAMEIAFMQDVIADLEQPGRMVVSSSAPRVESKRTEPHDAAPAHGGPCSQSVQPSPSPCAVESV